LYSVLDNKNLTIQGRPYWSVNSNESIPLGFWVKEEDEFEISIDNFDGEFENKRVSLEDKELNIMHDLSTSDYNFTSNSGEYQNRFVLHIKDKEIATEEVNEESVKNLIISSNSAGIQLQNKEYKMAKVEVYNILGSQIFSKDYSPTNLIEIATISDLKRNNQVVIVKVTYEDGYKEARKIVF
jgi:hypothetical protein